MSQNVGFKLKAPRPPRATENDSEAGCKTILQLRGWWFTKLHAGTFKSVDGRRWIKGVDKGTPDYVCLKGERGFLLEVKRPGEKPSAEQTTKHWELQRWFQLEIVTVESAEDLIGWLERFEHGP